MDSELLEKQLRNGRFDNVPDAIEGIFSDDLISRKFGGTARVTVSDILAELQKTDGPGSYRKTSHGIHGAWVQWNEDTPDHPDREEQISSYMNAMGDKIRGLYSIPSNDHSRVFSARFRHDQPADPPWDGVQKLGICILSRRRSSLPEGKVVWAHVQVVIQQSHAFTIAAREAAFDQLFECAICIFMSQLYRRFVLGMAIFKDYATFYYFDRAGVVTSDTFNIHENPEKFLRIIFGFLFASNTEHGYDPTIRSDDEGYFTTVKGKKFRLEGSLHEEPCVRGRGTICHIATLDGKKYVVKDSWVDDSCQSSEHQILKHLHGVAGVPTIAAFEVVKIGREKDTIKRLRKVFRKQKFFDEEELRWRSVQVQVDNREHRRLVTSPLGDCFESFSSLIELVSATRDLILIVRDLARRNILHCDISRRNIVLAKLDENAPLRRAFLIDYDTAINFVKQKALHAKRHRTGTLPYMALDLLVCGKDGNPEVAHAYYHDLESIFFVLCWICTILQGPNYEKRKDFDFGQATISGWVGPDPENPNYRRLRRYKETSVVEQDTFEKEVLGQFAPYFDDLHPCLSAMRLVLFNRDVDDYDSEYHDEVKDGRAALDEWATMSKRKRERAPEKFREKVRQAKRIVPLAYQHEDEVFSDLLKILDDTLDDLAKKYAAPSTAPTRSTRTLRSAAKSKRALSPDASLESNPKRSKRGND
ncbi:hypothetical protein DFH11DRAFT_1598800 [Phellopilus nigrolimitatus]|nr:hypothetical protein DFH11DRAFT_1598800 [Phellopilus nigrolimitatus]